MLEPSFCLVQTVCTPSIDCFYDYKVFTNLNVVLPQRNV